jgi:hypothetical protein
MNGFLRGRMAFRDQLYMALYPTDLGWTDRNRFQSESVSIGDTKLVFWLKTTNCQIKY